MVRIPVAIVAALLAVVALSLPTPGAAFGGGDGARKGMKGKMGGNIGGMKGQGGSGGPGAADVLAPEMREAFLAMQATDEAMDAHGLFATGLRPVYPDGLECRKLTSHFGVSTRSDGSRRSRRYYNGRHGGSDFPAKGIAIIAMADGEVVEKSTGGNIGGIKVVLRHAPQDTGLTVWTFTEYKHLKEESPLLMGARVAKGTPVGIAWNTGTTGGRAYGPEGFHHLHLTAWYNATGAYTETKMMLVPNDGYWMDPLALMRGKGPVDSAALKALDAAEKQVRFAYRTADGVDHPPDAKVIWPFVCR